MNLSGLKMPMIFRNSGTLATVLVPLMGNTLSYDPHPTVVLYWYTVTNTKSILVLGHDIWYIITKTNTKSIKIL